MHRFIDRLALARERLEWRYRCWRIHHFVWMAYKHWYDFPCSETYDTWTRWCRYEERSKLARP